MRVSHWFAHGIKPLMLLSMAALLTYTGSIYAVENAELEALTERFETRLAELREDHGFPGATAAFILPDGKARVVATGYADLEDEAPMTPEARLLSGSVGKTFAAAVTLSLSHEGLLSLDDPINKWLGGEPWFSRVPNGDAITIRHLLTHSSGLTDHVYDPRFVQKVNAELGKDEPDLDWYLKPEEAVELVLDKEPLFAPGEGYSYTDTGYILVGLIIEKATGSTYYDELRERVLDPLDLNRTSPSNKRALKGLASGYLQEDNPLGLPAKSADDGVMAINPATEWTGGGLVTNSLDLVKWAKALYEGKALGKPYLEDLLKSGYRGEDASRAYGLGVSIQDSPFGKVYGHSGWFPGYNTGMYYFADHGFAVAMQVNRDYDNDPGVYVRSLAQVVMRKLNP